MAGFVDCNKYKNDQEAVSTALGNLADADEKLSAKVDELDKRGINHDDTLTGDGLPDGTKLGVKKSDKSDNAVDTSDGVYVKDLEPRLKKVEDSRPTADDQLLDKSGSDGENGRITVEKIKEAIAGDVKVNVESDSGISGDGTKDNPLSLNLGKGLIIQDGAIVVDKPTLIGMIAEPNDDGSNDFLKLLQDNDLLGDGLTIKDGKLSVKTESIKDSSNKVHQFYAVVND